jgi:Family of unknown function (DUF6521)
METMVMEISETSIVRAIPKGNAIEHYVTLTRSPLLLVPIIESFFQAISPSKKNILLGYLVLPIVLYPASSNFLRTATSKSSIRTFCNDRSRLAGLAQRVAELRRTSSLAMQNSIDCERLILHRDLSMEFKEHQSNYMMGMQKNIKAAKRLASILDPYDVPTVYRLLGVNKL